VPLVAFALLCRHNTALAFTVLLCPYLMCAYPAWANTWTTPDGATVNGLPVAARADIVNNFGTTFTVTLINLEANSDLRRPASQRARHHVSKSGRSYRAVLPGQDDDGRCRRHGHAQRLVLRRVEPVVHDKQ
jgi:hypothetical protein